MSNSTRSAAVSRGNRTRSARREFASIYGETTASVIRELARGLTSTDVADLTGLPVTSVAAYKANLTRGAYAPFVAVTDGAVSGRCNW